MTLIEILSIRTTSDNFKFQKRVFFIFKFTAITECITLLALVVYWHLSRLEIMALKESERCFPMQKSIAVKHKACPDGLRELISNKSEETKACCGPISDVLKTITVKIVHDKYDSELAPEMAALDIKAFNCFETKSIPWIAHLVDVTSDKQPGQTNSPSKLFWNTGHPSYTHSEWTNLVDNGTLYIEKSGYYHVSSQLRSKIQNISCTNGVLCTKFKHFIYRISKPGDGQVLLEGHKSFCKTASGVSEFTSAIGAVFKLETGDKLHISISHPDSVLSDHSDNYFSIYSV